MSEQMNTERKITSHVLVEYGQVSANDKQGWARCVRLVSWNDRPAKFDIREWNGDKAGKGITLTKEEMRNLRDILNGINMDLLPADMATGQNGSFKGDADFPTPDNQPF